MKKNAFLLPLWIMLLSGSLFSTKLSAQEAKPVQTIRGIVVDRSSGAPIEAVSVWLAEFPDIVTSTNQDGEFVLQNRPAGRYNLHASIMGYESAVVREIMLSSAKEVYLRVQLKENVQQLDEVIIQSRVSKEKPLNNMALTGARMLSVEEASRFAGGMDDPARLVSAFAGVSSGVATNGISIHGNAPSLLQWRLEGVEIPNPNHFADVASLGGGVLSSLSSHVLDNSDFFTSAFPAEYQNAISGVFDMKLRKGNNQDFEHTVQVGLLGLDVASEGPLNKNHEASYLFNYRYSTTGLLNKINPAGELEQVMDYQDLNFKFNFPTAKAGVFSIWGTGLIDNIKPEIAAAEEWAYLEDAKDSRMKQTSGAAGLSHQYFFGEKGNLKTTLATTYSKTAAWEQVFDLDMNSAPNFDFKSRYTHVVLTSSYNRKYSAKHTNRTGFTLTNMHYDMQSKLAPYFTEPLQQIAKGAGNTTLWSAYTSSLLTFNDRLTATVGLTGQLFTLNKNWTLEPRASLKWKASAKSDLSLAYGLHSRLEKLDVYFVQTEHTGSRLVNKELDFAKSHHISLAYDYKIGTNMHLTLEPYFQYLYDVPVQAGSPYSLLNRTTFYVKKALVNQGEGRNYGLDLTIEKYMTKGLYYMVTASLFNSTYSGGDHVWHSTRFNRNYILNGLIGKEWNIGRHNRNVLGANIRLTLQGGDRYSPVATEESLAHPDKETQYDETRAYSKQLPPIFLAHYSLSYRMNRNKVSHEFALKGLNATGYGEYLGHAYNLQTDVIEPRRMKNSLLNIVYRLDF